MINIDTDKICNEYGSIQEFLRQENITEGVFYSLKHKKTKRFSRKHGERVWNTFKKLEKLGLIKEQEVA